MTPIAPAICAARGRTFSDWSDDSVRKICMPPICSMGSTAIAMTMIPIPPSHWSSARHKRIPGGASSSPTITVDPVVVRPDMASKNASV